MPFKANQRDSFSQNIANNILHIICIHLFIQCHLEEMKRKKKEEREKEREREIKREREREREEETLVHPSGKKVCSQCKTITIRHYILVIQSKFSFS